MTPKKRYIFNVDSEYNSDLHTWIKEYDLSIDTDHPINIAHETKEIDNKFFKYMTIMEFESDEKAKNWFVNHYKSF